MVMHADIEPVCRLQQGIRAAPEALHDPGFANPLTLARAKHVGQFIPQGDEGNDFAVHFGNLILHHLINFIGLVGPVRQGGKLAHLDHAKAELSCSKNESQHGGNLI